jgi:hypothetical protein
VLIMATVIENSGVQLYYTIKQDGFEDSALQNPNGSGWETFKPLSLPNDPIGDPSVAAREAAELTDKQGGYLLRSIHNSADLSAPAPAQLVSHDGHLCVFRQSTRGTLLADRFVLDGMTNTLTPKLEVRYKRSRQRYAPFKAMKINSGGQMESLDSLDFRDMQNRPFIEPTTELCPQLLNTLHDGWFGVIVTPTNEQETHRWHIFAHNRSSGKIDLVTLAGGRDRLFDVQDAWFRIIDPITDQAQYDSIPGLTHRALELLDSAGKPLTISNGLAATTYDVQREQQTQNGPQLVRESSKVLLAVPTSAGAATLSFAIAADGRLAQIAGDGDDRLLRSQEREILLPLDLLDNIRPLGDSSAAPAGVIVGMSRSDDDDSPDRVRVAVAKDDKAAVGKLKSGDTVKLSNTTSYNGLYRVSKADDGSFVIDAAFKFGEIGEWEKVEEEESGLIFDGMMTGYEKTRDGKLKVCAVNHGLAAGDLVQIVGDGDYAGEYPVLKHDEDSFTIQRLWATGEAVNIKLESRQRRGLALDGKRDWIAAPCSQVINLSAGFTVEAWVKLNNDADQTILATQPDLAPGGMASAAAAATLSVQDGKFTVAITRPLLGRTSALRLASPTSAPLREWVHVACSFDGKELHLLENGEVKASITLEELNRKAKVGQEALVKQLQQDVADLRAAFAAAPNHPANYWVRLASRVDDKAVTAGLETALSRDVIEHRAEQLWRLERQEDGAYAVRNKATNRVLEFMGGDQPVQQTEWRNADSQKWALEANANGFYTFRARIDGKVLDGFRGGFVAGNAWHPDTTNAAWQQWRLEPVGPTLAVEIQAAIDALEGKGKQGKPSFSLGVSTLSLGATQQLKAGKLQLVDLLQGQMADVRLWTSGRSDKAIADAMHLQLTGRKAGLAGYWRLGGFAVEEDGSQRVFDFSVNANHGLAQGAPYAGGVTLGRTLRDGKTAAVKFSNDDLFAVREGAIYVESFEFRTDKLVDAKNADGKDGVIFAPSLWGRLSRNAEEKQAFAPMQENYQFKALDDGWQSATCRFLIPEGVRLLRCFELTAVAGEWSTLEVRRHTIRLVSDTVTLSTLEESVCLPTLAVPLAQDPGQRTQPADLLIELAAKEYEEAPLVTRHKELERLLADIQNRSETERRRNDYQNLVQSLTWARDARQREYDAALANPPTGAAKTDLWGEGYGSDAIHIDWHIHTAQVIAPPGKQVMGVQFYKLSARLAVKILCAYADHTGEEWIVNEDLNGNAADHQDWIDIAPVQCPKGKVITGVQFYKKGNRSAIQIRCSYPWGGGDEWVANDKEEGFFRSRRSEQNDFIDMHPVLLDEDAVASGLQIRQYGNRIAPLLPYYSTAESERARNALNRANDELSAAQAELERLNQALNANDSQRAAWEQELREVAEKLAAIRTRIASLTTAYLTTVAKANSTAQTMSDLPDQEDPRGLTVQGALLPFALPAGRLHLMESCAGRVTLSYLDGDGNLRQTHYDAAYDADGKGEEWLPEGYRAALALDGRGLALPLPAGLFDGLNNQITIEFWAKGGSDLPRANALLGAFDGEGKRRLCIQLPNENGDVVWEAGQQPANGAIDSLVKAADAGLYRGRWNHWAFVKDGNAGEMRIYLNGKLWVKSNARAKDGGGPRTQSLSGVSQAALGGFSRQTPNWHGQLCELRIWSAALGEREIEANSVLTLSGGEPGLLAYYPLSEAQGDQGRDQTGRGRHIAAGGAAWAACTAPIGRPAIALPITLLGQPMTFDGDYDFVQLPTLNVDLRDGLTIEARVTYQGFRNWSRILDIGNGPGKQSILLANQGESQKLILQVFDEQGAVSELLAATDLPYAQSTHIAATIAVDGMAHLYINGVEVASGKVRIPPSVARTSNYIGKSNWGDRLFYGQMDYVRLYTRPLDNAAIKQLAQIGAAEPAVICAEYSRVRVDAQRRKSVMMLRSLALPTLGGLRLIDEQRIEELEMTWIGNAQIKPTLIGYIEGAPPLPSENLTEEQDYNGATAVELIQSSEVEYSWTRETDTSLGVEAEFLVGVKSETSAGIGMMTSVEEIKTGVGAKASFAYHWQNASTVGASHSLMSSDRLELRGTQEAEAHFPHLGQRFIPKNIGYALVTSGLADVFVSKLKRSGRMIGYQVLPVEGVPLDVNTITFLINPAYTMAGSLDGLTGSRATSDRFFGHVPEMRSQYGSLYPASYFRLKEAYDLKNQIDQQDKLHESYFNQFNAGYVNEGDIDRQMYSNRKDDKTVQVGGGGSDDQDREIEARKKELADLKKATPVDQAAVDAKQREIDDLETARKNKAQGQRKEAGEERQNQINATHSDLSDRANASDGFASWQRKLETLQIRAGKRNIVNTYVWDGDGGFHAEEQQFASTVEHSVGGSFDMSLAIGGQMSYAMTKVLVELNAYAGFNMTQTMSKTESSSKGLELHVDLSGVESRGITDYRDHPILPGEKVDRYRFMSFFLENSTNHWHDFFNYVVDPEWLASNDEEARALRQTQSALPNKVWRVLHRVTYVERPALMGFGRSVVKKDEAADDIRALRDQLTDLQGKVTTLQKEINEKLDQLLMRKA